MAATGGRRDLDAAARRDLDAAARRDLDAASRALVRMSAALAAGGADAAGSGLEDAMREAAAHATADQVEEALLQSYLFLGYPAALNALALWRGVAAGRRGDQASPRDEARSRDEAPPRDEDDPRRWMVRGEEVCRRVYAGQYGGLRDNIRALHPEMERWMVEEGYGKVLGRPGLSLPVRELCIAAILTVAGAPTQLYSHLRGALNTGASAEAVEEALEIALEHTPAHRRDAARGTWRRVLDRRNGRNPD